MMRTNTIVFNCRKDFFEQFDFSSELDPITAEAPTMQEGEDEPNYSTTRTSESTYRGFTANQDKAAVKMSSRNLSSKSVSILLLPRTWKARRIKENRTSRANG